jgi:hypothetical protein
MEPWGLQPLPNQVLSDWIKKPILKKVKKHPYGNTVIRQMAPFGNRPVHGCGLFFSGLPHPV